MSGVCLGFVGDCVGRMLGFVSGVVSRISSGACREHVRVQRVQKPPAVSERFQKQGVKGFWEVYDEIVQARYLSKPQRQKVQGVAYRSAADTATAFRGDGGADRHFVPEIQQVSDRSRGFYRDSQGCKKVRSCPKNCPNQMALNLSKKKVCGFGGQAQYSHALPWSCSGKGFL